MVNETSVHIRALPPPGEVRAALPASTADLANVQKWRQTIIDILSRTDPRLLIIIGPCAVQSVEATLEYAARLKALSAKLADRFFIVMRGYVEKSRSAASWKGYLYNQNGKNSLHNGLFESRALFLRLVSDGMPIAMEFLDPLAADYVSDLVAWGCIGARTVQSPIHRELASRLPMPVGMKNTTDGSIDVAIQALCAVRKTHISFGITEEGRVCEILSPGNPNSHLVLRGGIFGPNYRPPQIQKAADLLHQASLPNALVVDCSHGNSQKNWERQPEIFLDVLQSALTSSESPVRGLMVESFLLEGTQEALLKKHCKKLSERDIHYGASPIDGCIGWNGTVEMLTSAYEKCCTMKERVVQ